MDMIRGREGDGKIGREGGMGCLPMLPHQAFKHINIYENASDTSI